MAYRNGPAQILAAAEYKPGYYDANTPLDVDGSRRQKGLNSSTRRCTNALIKAQEMMDLYTSLADSSL